MPILLSASICWSVSFSKSCLKIESARLGRGAALMSYVRPSVGVVLVTFVVEGVTLW